MKNKCDMCPHLPKEGVFAPNAVVLGCCSAHNLNLCEEHWKQYTDNKRRHLIKTNGNCYSWAKIEITKLGLTNTKYKGENNG